MGHGEDTPFHEHAALIAELYPGAADVERALTGKGYATEHIGLGCVCEGNVIHTDEKDRLWVFGPLLRLCEDGRSIASGLRRDGLPIAEDSFRVVWGMPSGWDPLDTMERFSAHVYRGCLVDDVRLLGVPIARAGSAWAYWLGVRIGGLPAGPLVPFEEPR
jgi:hypothetical protein